MQIKEIDFVVAWVDGNDPQLNKLRLKYWQEQDQSSCTPKPNPPPSQYANNNEIIYCIASILRNAAFVRRIHVITDRQTPALEALADFGFSDAELAKISIVDHRDIFGNLAELAPTFNAMSIETLIHRTPGLADHFVYMNDDFFILKPTSPSDYFAAPETPIVNGKILPYSRTYLRIKLSLLDILKKRKNVRWSFLTGCMSGAMAAGLRFRYVCLDHSPRPMFRPILNEYFESRPKVLRDNAKHRFRHHRQFQPQALASCLSLNQRKLKVNRDTGVVGYIRPDSASGFDAQFDALIDESGQPPESMRFLCIQNLDQAKELEQMRLLTYLGSVLKADQ
jgi:hypothetical protein